MTRSRIDLGDVTVHNIKQLKRVNQVVFPVAYNDKFYKDVLEVGELAKLTYFNDIVVGAVCCREDKTEGQRRLYIMTLGCLAPYRRHHIGTTMLEHVLSICEKDGNYDNVFLHVQVNNEGAIKFYEKFGFKIVERKQNYYKRIEPADAFVLQKTFKDTGCSSPVPMTCAENSNDIKDSTEKDEAEDKLNGNTTEDRSGDDNKENLQNSRHSGHRKDDKKTGKGNEKS